MTDTESDRPLHAADGHEIIRVRGARVNNLKNVNVDIPKRRVTVFTGVSGSGKSSLVFGTIAAESQRMINETYSSFVQTFMPSLARPDVDVLEGLTTAILVDQERMGANTRSTVGTATDAHAMLRILFSRSGVPSAGSPQAYSFNISSGGMCPKCGGMGTVNDIALEELYDKTKSLRGGALTIPGYTPDGWAVRLYTESGVVPADTPIQDFSATQLQDFLYKEPTKTKIAGINMTYEGLVLKIQKSMLSKDRDAMQPHVRAFVERAVTFSDCPACAGSRLNAAARESKIDGVSIADASAMQISDLAQWMQSIDAPSVAPVVAGIRELLRSFVDVGLGYLSLDRSAGTLSGGEAQRTKMIRHLGSSLTDVTYVFDEPTVGLHPHDIERMNELILRLRDKGNTVLVVEHKPETIVIADHVVDIGPRAGTAGGEIMFEGTVDQLRSSDTLTGRHLDDRSALKSEVRTSTGMLSVRGASSHNLRNIDVDIPLGVLVAVTGVAGSGKSSLIDGSVAHREGVVAIDQSPIKGSRRSSPATYTGLLDPVRKAFAKAHGVKPALFSANSEGGCLSCKGAGVIFTELGPLQTSETMCEDCDGKGFRAEVLEYHLAGRSILDVLDMPAAEAEKFFSEENSRVLAAHKILTRLVDVGLGYITLGQPLTAMSGGERQRLKLAIQMADDGDVYILDEPTTGLHLADVEHLLSLLDRLVDSGKSVVVIEHHQAVMAHADWIIDVGPGAGHDGGVIVFEGTPRELVAERKTLTAEHLARYIGL